MYGSKIVRILFQQAHHPRRSAWNTCARPRASRSRPTRSLSCSAIWRESSSLPSRSVKLRRARLEQLKQAPKARPNLMVLVLMRVIGIGIETADMLVKEILLRNLRDRRAVARYGGLTGSPDESGSQRREQGLARSGNARVRKGMIQLAWR